MDAPFGCTVQGAGWATGLNSPAGLAARGSVGRAGVRLGRPVLGVFIGGPYAVLPVVGFLWMALALSIAGLALIGIVFYRALTRLRPRSEASQGSPIERALCLPEAKLVEDRGKSVVVGVL